MRTSSAPCCWPSRCRRHWRPRCTNIGALIGGGLGLAWEGIKDLLKPAEQKPVDVNARMTVGLAPGLVLQNQTMQTSGGNVQMNTGNFWTGAPR